jgi:hypothetical protein
VKNNKPDISLIRRYLNGDLDAAAMYQLERQAQDDPLLLDMIQGMENGDEARDKGNLQEIGQLIQKRVEAGSGNTRKFIAWKGWAAAASLVLISTIAALLIYRTPLQQKKDREQVKLNRRAPVDTPRDQQSRIFQEPGVGKSSVENRTVEKSSPEELTVQDRRLNHRGTKSAPATVPQTGSNALPVETHTALAKNGQTIRSVEASKYAAKEEKAVTAVIPDSAVRGNLADLHVKTENAGLREVVVSNHPIALEGRVAGVNVDAAVRSKSFGNQELNESVVTKGYNAKRETAPAVLKPSILGKAHPVIGWDAFKKYLKDNAVIPGAVISGHVNVAFMIDRNGAPVRVMVIKPLSEVANRIAVDLIRNGPKWTGDQEELDKIITIKIKFR